jgi:hypothetical protein
MSCSGCGIGAPCQFLGLQPHQAHTTLHKAIVLFEAARPGGGGPPNILHHMAQAWPVTRGTCHPTVIHGRTVVSAWHGCISSHCTTWHLGGITMGLHL